MEFERASSSSLIVTRVLQSRVFGLSKIFDEIVANGDDTLVGLHACMVRGI